MKYLVLVFLLVIPSIASAQDSIEVPFPDSTRVMRQHVEYRAFDIAAFRRLLEMRLELETTLRQVALLTQQVDTYRIQIMDYESVREQQEESIQLLIGDRTRLTERWEELNLRFRRQQHRPNIGGVLAWVVAGVSLSTVAGFSIHYAVN